MISSSTSFYMYDKDKLICLRILLDVHLTEYRVLEVIIWTHAVGGLTTSDFILAAAIEKVKVDFSPKWLQSHPEFAHMNL